MSVPDRTTSKQDQLLGMDQYKITRRDFVNSLLVGVGVALLEMPAPIRVLAQKKQQPSWEGYGGVGDYASSPGNTEEVTRVAHQMRDGNFDPPANFKNTGEVYDLVIVGGGMTGLAAAYYFKKAGRGKCLVIENHRIFGGESKRNEFMVNGQRLIGPQAANSFAIPEQGTGIGYELYNELEIPKTFDYQRWDPKFKPLKFDRENYASMFWCDETMKVGYFFDKLAEGDKPRWILAEELWQTHLNGTKYSQQVRADFHTWRNTTQRYYEGNDFAHWLDTMTYKDYVEKVMGLSPEIIKFVDPVIAAGVGLGSDVISAYTAYVIMPGFKGFSGTKAKTLVEEISPPCHWHSFPGGNDGFSRHLIKALIPNAIQGGRNFVDIMNGRVNFGALDDPANLVRIRLGATAVRVEHSGTPRSSEQVEVGYVEAGKLYRLKARGVVMATGGWVTPYVVKDLPSEHQDAFQEFHHAPILVANVALTNWRFLYKLGYTACRWNEGFGFHCNIRQPMIVGDYRPRLDPNQPTILTFYVPFYYPGGTIEQQGFKGRLEMMSTSYVEYERKIRLQMVKLFGGVGFNPRRDIAGIILNRWGHAYVCPQPGYYFGRDGKSAPRDVVRNCFGRIAFGHSELEGIQSWLGAATEGRRAVEQLMEIL